MDEQNKYPAFCKWFERNFADDLDMATAYLAQSCYDNSNELVWEYLKKTGDQTYMPETFYKAAKFILEEAKNG